MMQQLRFGLIGLGYWGPKLARNLESLPQASLEIVADLNLLALRKAKDERPWITTTHGSRTSSTRMSMLS